MNASPGFLKLDDVSVLHGRILEGPHRLDEGRLVEAVTSAGGRRGGHDAGPDDGPLGQSLAGGHLDSKPKITLVYNNKEVCHFATS